MVEVRYNIKVMSGTAGERANKFYSWKGKALRGDKPVELAPVRHEETEHIHYRLDVRHYKNTTITLQAFESDRGIISIYGDSEKKINKIEKIILKVPHEDIKITKINP